MFQMNLVLHHQGARYNILYHIVWYNRARGSSCSEVVGKSRLACTIVPIVLRNTIYYAVLLMLND